MISIRSTGPFIALALFACGDDVAPTPVPQPTCCEAGESCAEGVPECPETCAGAVCEEGERCELGPDGEAVGCTASCALPCAEDLCCATGASCLEGACKAANLVLEVPDPAAAIHFGGEDVPEDSCQLADGCFGGSGRRAQVHLDVNVKNAGDAPLALGEPGGDVFRASFCEGSWVLDHFLHAEMRNAEGDTVAEGWLPTTCVADDGGDCEAQILEPGAVSTAHPIAACDFIDATGLTGGEYELVVTVNPDHALAESDFSDNQITIPFSYPACDGQTCGGVCCPAPAECEANECQVPDLRINKEAAEESITFENLFVAPNECTIVEGCVGGTGVRRLLKFTGRIENWGPAHLSPGAEPGNPLFEFSTCHGHYHFLDFTNYEVLNLDMTVAAQGHKQSFCLLNMDPVDPNNTDPPPPPPPGSLGCSFLAAGWADIYGSGTECQWVDITDVDPGDYILQLAVNPIGKIPEVATENNVIQIPVTIPEEEPCVPEPEICGDGLDQDCDFIPDNGCCLEFDSEICGNAIDDDCNDVVDDGCTPLSGTDVCATAPVLPVGAAYLTIIDGNTTSEVSPSCGGAGADVFFRFTLPQDEVVYLSTMGSDIDTVLTLFQGGCGGAEVACSDDACFDFNGHFAQMLTAGDYAVAIKAKTAGDTGDVRLKFTRGGCADAMELTTPGIYSGDTIDSLSTAASGCGSTGNRDVYFLAACEFQSLYFSTCGTSAFDSVLHSSKTCGGASSECSYDGDGCSDPNGATLQTYVSTNGLLMLSVEGAGALDAGAYQLMASF